MAFKDGQNLGRWKASDLFSFQFLEVYLYDYKLPLQNDLLFSLPTSTSSLCSSHFPQGNSMVVPRTLPSSIGNWPPSYLHMGLVLADQKSNLCKINARRSEWSGAQLELPDFLVYPPEQLGHWVYNAPATINIFTVLCIYSMESIQFPWNILYIPDINAQLIIHLYSWFLLPLSYMISFMHVLKGTVFIHEFESVHRMPTGTVSRVEFLTSRNIHFYGSRQKTMK